ncbi:alpha/beta fold hydrolase [Microbacterium sp. NC79]|uniref:alpha/beta fold hydrolase n=1 Tax=Microbacterium sp. NC79 TaxID=2851009 RepID=UPI001C2BCA6C|nr:alpha/beta hydrolase [Microbacterium sp. NC79]MBV0895529.1 alpha/beta fold hydrolase [Microbacterium sp. NC79]
MAETPQTPFTFENTARFVQTPGFRLHYHDAGSGDVVLFLHGSGPGATGWSNFRLNIEAIAKTHRVLLLDQPGWGESGAFESAPGGHLQAITEFLDTLGIERVSLVGNSMGGINAIEFTMTHPERVDKLITMGAPDMSHPNVFSPGGFSLGLQAVYHGYVERTPAVYRRLVDVMTFGDAFLDDDLIAERLQSALNHEEHLDAFLKRGSAPRIGPEWTQATVAAITQPTLLIHGRDDQVVPYEATLRLLTMIPNSRALLFNQCGHWAQLEKADEFNRVVSGFLREA